MWAEAPACAELELPLEFAAAQRRRHQELSRAATADGFGAGTLLIADHTWVITRESGELVLAPASPQGFRFNSRAQLLPGVVRAYPALAGGRYFVRNARQLRAFDLTRR